MSAVTATVTNNTMYHTDSQTMMLTTMYNFVVITKILQAFHYLQPIENQLPTTKYHVHLMNELNPALKVSELKK